MRIEEVPFGLLYDALPNVRMNDEWFQIMSCSSVMATFSSSFLFFLSLTFSRAKILNHFPNSNLKKKNLAIRLVCFLFWAFCLDVLKYLDGIPLRKLLFYTSMDKRRLNSERERKYTATNQQRPRKTGQEDDEEWSNDSKWNSTINYVCGCDGGRWKNKTKQNQKKKMKLTVEFVTVEMRWL